jgi:hypothetical protein
MAACSVLVAGMSSLGTGIAMAQVLGDPWGVPEAREGSGMSPEERRDEIRSVMREISGLLSKESDFCASGLAAIEAGSLDRLANVSEELLICHATYAVQYRRLMGLWLRPAAGGVMNSR